MVGSMETDQVLQSIATKTTDTQSPFESQHAVRQPQRFQKKIEGLNPDELTLLTRDDSDALRQYAERIRSTLQDSMGHGSVLLRGLVKAYMPGTAIPKTSGRVVPFNMTYGTERPIYPQVVGVGWVFSQGAGKTELVLDSQRARVTV